MIGQPRERFDVAVVGLGLIGSAALRHLAADGSRTVVGVGPGEPQAITDSVGPFASHYDSGRITRRLDAERSWAILASRSIDQYPVIERASGLSFHRPAGLIFVRNDADGIAKQLAVAKELGIPLDVGLFADRVQHLPGLSFPLGDTVLHEGPPAGHIDPRILVEAQLKASAKSGAVVHRTAVVSLQQTNTGAWEIGIIGDTIVADRVVMATGPYPNGLLQQHLAVSVRPEAVVMGEVDDATVEALAGMPSIIHLLDHPDLDDVYVVPPVRYPDGKTYVKMGGSHRLAPSFASAAEKAAWMTGNEADLQLTIMRDVLCAMLPSTAFMSWAMKPCLISDTLSGLPYVGKVEEGLTVAVGGNGHAAKSSDAIGALAADLVRNDGAWTDRDLSADDFRVQFGGYEPGPGSRHGN